MPECFVTKASEMQDGDRRIVVAGNAEIGVFYKDGAYFAYSNTCVHAGGPACEGLMINRVVDVIAADRTYQGQTFSDEVHFVCPWHGYEYELQTGECVGDRRLRLKKFDVVRRGTISSSSFRNGTRRVTPRRRRPWTWPAAKCASSPPRTIRPRSTSSMPRGKRASATTRIFSSSTWTRTTTRASLTNEVFAY